MSDAQTRQPIIAIFGPNEPNDAQLNAARMLAGQINRSGAVLLTGGTGRRGTRQVKEEAIRAAKAAAAHKREAVWIGVRNADGAQRLEPVFDDSYIVTPGWADRRNFVEACLCDAALAVGDSPGTASEILFCLYLQRPVIRVGLEAPAIEEDELDTLCESAKLRISTPEGDPTLCVDKGIKAAYQRPRELGLPNHHKFPADKAEAADIVAELLALATVTTPAPALHKFVDQTTWDEFVCAEILRSGRLNPKGPKIEGGVAGAVP